MGIPLDVRERERIFLVMKYDQQNQSQSQQTNLNLFSQLAVKQTNRYQPDYICTSRVA